MLTEKITDPDLRRVIHLFITAFDDKAEGSGKSLGLGSQISQLCAVYYPNKLDHFAKETLRIKGYGRYMDDIYLIHKDKKYLKHCLAELQKLCAELKIAINLKKTRISKLSDGVPFLKGRYTLFSTGRVLVTPLNNKGTIRMKLKLKKMAKKVALGTIHYWGVFQTYYSWRQNFLKRFSAYYRIQSVDEVFWECMKEYHTFYDNPPLLNMEPAPLYPFEKIGLLEKDKEDVCAALAVRSNNYFCENETGYVYAGGFIKA
jgi:hypothetical protein